MHHLQRSHTDIQNEIFALLTFIKRVRGGVCDQAWLTCQYNSHDGVLQKRVVDYVPKPLEVGEDVMNHMRTGLQQEVHSGPELSCTQETQKNSVLTTLLDFI